MNHSQSSGHFHMVFDFQLLQNMPSCHIKVKKDIAHVFDMTIPSHTSESAYDLTHHTQLFLAIPAG